MCVVSTVQKIFFEQDGESSGDPRGHQRNSMTNSKVRGLQLGDFLRYGRFLTIAVLMAAYLGHQASESKSFSKLDLSWLVRKEPTTTTQSWWVVAYALIAYTMFGSGRWLIHRSFKRITTATSSVFQQVASQEALTKIRSSVSMRSIQLFGACQHDDEHCGKRTLTLSVEKPFVSEAHVATMTLGDIKDVFQFAFQCDTVNFDSEAFASELREPARQAIEMLDLAVRLSRGERVGSRVCEKSSEFGSLDVLTFIGACRIFAEWRPIRLVPEGYGRYSFGMNIGRRDMLGNITKAEKAIHAYLDEKVQQANGETVSSPSIRDILEYELATNKHTRRPTLANNTAAQGILWLKRQLQYQTAIFTNTSEIPYQFPDSKAAVSLEIRGSSFDDTTNSTTHTSRIMTGSGSLRACLWSLPWILRTRNLSKLVRCSSSSERHSSSHESTETSRKKSRYKFAGRRR